MSLSKLSTGTIDVFTEEIVDELSQKGSDGKRVRPVKKMRLAIKIFEESGGLRLQNHKAMRVSNSGSCKINNPLWNAGATPRIIPKITDNLVLTWFFNHNIPNKIVDSTNEYSIMWWSILPDKCNSCVSGEKEKQATARIVKGSDSFSETAIAIINAVLISVIKGGIFNNI